MNETIPPKLLSTIQESYGCQPSPAVELLVQRLLSDYSDAVQGILFYGSCLHKKDDLEGLFDLYLLVKDYDAVNRSSMHALLNRLLPPNVFYMEVPYGQQTVRAKYAILSLDDLLKGTSRAWFHSYLWARFCQPTLLVWERDSAVAEIVNRAFAQAVITFVGRVLPALERDFSIRDLWQKGLELTYRAELRPEQANMQVRLFDSKPEYFTAVTRHAFDGISYPVKPHPGPDPDRYIADIPSSEKFSSHLSWTLRIMQGKILSIARLIKGTLTFDGGVEYITWKIHRHTGVRVEVSPFLKKHPVLAMFALSLQLFRRGGVK